MIEWHKYPNFSEDEFKCSASGVCIMRPIFLEALQELRHKYGKSMVISSGYREGFMEVYNECNWKTRRFKL